MYYEYFNPLKNINLVAIVDSDRRRLLFFLILLDSRVAADNLWEVVAQRAIAQMPIANNVHHKTIMVAARGSTHGGRRRRRCSGQLDNNIILILL